MNQHDHESVRPLKAANCTRWETWLEFDPAELPHAEIETHTATCESCRREWLEWLDCEAATLAAAAWSGMWPATPELGSTSGEPILDAQSTLATPVSAGSTLGPSAENSRVNAGWIWLPLLGLAATLVGIGLWLKEGGISPPGNAPVLDLPPVIADSSETIPSAAAGANRIATVSPSSLAPTQTDDPLTAEQVALGVTAEWRDQVRNLARQLHQQPLPNPSAIASRSEQSTDGLESPPSPNSTSAGSPLKLLSAGWQAPAYRRGNVTVIPIVVFQSSEESESTLN